MAFATNRTLDRFPPAAILAALLLAALLAAPSVALGDSVSSGAPPAQYRGPSSEVSTRWLPLQDSRLAGGGDPARYAEGWSRWESWFEHEKDGLLRDLLSRGAAGDAPAPAPVDALRPQDRARRVLPALRAALRSDDASVRAAAALALGNARDVASVPDLARLLRTGPAADRRTAALALGFLGGPDAATALERALDDEPTADGRAVAAVGLGLARHPASGRVLREALGRNLESSGREARELRAALVTALGLLRDREAVPVLQRILLAPDLRDDRARSHAASALGRIGDPAAVPPLVRALYDDDAGVRRAAALALGAFRDESAAAALRRLVAESAYPLERGYAAISLARSAGASAVPTLLPLLAGKVDRGVRGFAALALGLTGARSEAAPALRGLLALRSEDSVRGAAAIGLGLLADRASLPDLARVSADAASSPELRGHALLARAMAGDPAAVPDVRRALAGATPEVERAAALAAGLRPFPGSSALLVRLALEAREPTVRGAALLGLGLAPDRAGAPLLADLAGGEGVPALDRIEAATALGQLGLDGALPPVARIASGADSRSFTPMIDRMARVF